MTAENLILSSSTIDKKLEIFEIFVNFENYSYFLLENELKIDKNLENILEIFQFFVDFEFFCQW